MLYENNMKALYAKLSATGLFHVVAENNLHMLKSPTACAGLNLVFGAITDYGLAAARHLFQAAPFSYITDRIDTTRDQLLNLNNYRLQSTMPEMTLSTPAPALIQISPDITIVPVDSLPLLHYWCSILATTFELPYSLVQQYAGPVFELQQASFASGIMLLIGFFKTTPAITALVHRDNQVACISSMATLPEFQRQGLGTAMLQSCLEQERVAGTTHMTLISTRAGQALYKKMGFQTTRSLKIFARDV